ncbi:hypothetical protein ACW73L_08220 [Methylolobus aquaticus]
MGHHAQQNRRSFYEFGNRLVQALVNTLFQADFKDIMSGYRAFSRSFVINYPILVEGFQIETEMALHALCRRFRVIEIPIEYKDRPLGSQSKLSTFADRARVVFAIGQIFRFYRPLLFFTTVSALFALCGLLAAVPVFQDWFTIRYIEHIPLSILASALGIVALLMLSVMPYIYGYTAWIVGTGGAYPFLFDLQCVLSDLHPLGESLTLCEAVSREWMLISIAISNRAGHLPSVWHQ